MMGMMESKQVVWQRPGAEGYAPRAFRLDGTLGVLLVLAMTLIAGREAHAQSSQANWWEGITGFGTPSYTDRPRTERTPPKPDPVNDLRPGSVPWRSDEMLDNVDRAIAHYLRIAEKGGWPAVPGNRMLRPGDDDERVPALRRRLRATGELKTSGSGFENYNFDGVLEEAVRRFQDRHGLRTSGRVDKPTLAALNVSVQDRIAQLELNRNRIVQLLQMPIEERYILVNVPAFQLEAVERFDVQLRHRVVAGRVGRETPDLQATIRGLNFFPSWRVPDSVARLDVFPRLVKEPEYLQQEKIRVVLGDFNGPEIDPSSIDWSQADASRVKLRQDPGPQNALGLVRIDMQNEHGVYMHDTPLKNLFEQRSRAFSAGCVRVQDVFKLVEWLARYEPGWETPGQADAVIESGMALDVVLSRPVPVYFAYISGWAEADGTIHFRHDIYNRDGQPYGPVDMVDADSPPPPAPGLAP